jgi:hypothetical protein
MLNLSSKSVIGIGIAIEKRQPGSYVGADPDPDFDEKTPGRYGIKYLFLTIGSFLHFT